MIAKRNKGNCGRFIITGKPFPTKATNIVMLGSTLSGKANNFDLYFSSEIDVSKQQIVPEEPARMDSSGQWMIL